MTFGSFMISDATDAPPPPVVVMHDPATCTECDRARMDAEANFFGATVRVVKVKSPPIVASPPANTEPTEGPEKDRGDVTFSSSGRRRVAPTKWWQVNGKSSAGDKSAEAVTGQTPQGGKGTAFIVDAAYSVWRLKLMALERLHVHPLDQRMYHFATGGELRNGDTLGAAGVRPECRIAVVCGEEHDPEDLTGLDMPTGPVRWEDGPRDGGGGGREEKATTRAPERGFAGTGLHGVG